jgi:hypothetical protein
MTSCTTTTAMMTRVLHLHRNDWSAEEHLVLLLYSPFSPFFSLDAFLLAANDGRARLETRPALGWMTRLGESDV